MPPTPKSTTTTSTQKQNLDHKTPEAPIIKQQTSKQWIKSSKGISDKIIEKKVKTDNLNVGLQLNPEDFMVKIRSKTIGSVPKDARSKLKTSAYGHVENIPKYKGEIDVDHPKTPVEIKVSEKSSKVKTPARPSELFNKNNQMTHSQPVVTSKIKKSIEDYKPVDLEKSSQEPTELEKSSQEPTELEKVSQESTEIEKSSQKPTVSEKPLLIIDKKQAEHARKTLIELKLKKADLYKMKLDFDMKELNGEISAEELEEKKKKIRGYEEKIESQIQELQKLLEN